jgi:hypothetical protein
LRPGTSPPPVKRPIVFFVTASSKIKIMIPELIF